MFIVTQAYVDKVFNTIHSIYCIYCIMFIKKKKKIHFNLQQKCMKQAEKSSILKKINRQFQRPLFN